MMVTYPLKDQGAGFWCQWIISYNQIFNDTIAIQHLANQKLDAIIGESITCEIDL